MSQPPNSDMDWDLLACLIGLSLSTHHYHHRQLCITCFSYHQTFDVGMLFNCSSISYCLDFSWYYCGIYCVNENKTSILFKISIKITKFWGNASISLFEASCNCKIWNKMPLTIKLKNNQTIRSMNCSFNFCICTWVEHKNKINPPETGTSALMASRCSGSLLSWQIL